MPYKLVFTKQLREKEENQLELKTFFHTNFNFHEQFLKENEKQRGYTNNCMETGEDVGNYLFS